MDLKDTRKEIKKTFYHLAQESNETHPKSAEVSGGDPSAFVLMGCLIEVHFSMPLS